MPMSRLMLSMLAAATLLAAGPALALDDAAYSTMNRTAIEQHILPRYDALAGDAWQDIQHVTFGPVDLFFRSRSEEHTSELQSLMRTSYAVYCLQKKNHTPTTP